ncbi:MAG TPA: MFS transporter [Casimicrobiaceae bacterium]|nr:MFS transporter [Casimicrobiaceae bacterium]
MIRSAGYLPPRTLVALILLGICNHALLTGARVTVSLNALANGASAALVGLLMALFALLPMLCAVPAGRLVDRIGARRPMLWGSIGCLVAAALPALLPGLPSLFVAAALSGLAFMSFQIPAQRVTGELGTEQDRAANFSWLAMGYAGSGFIGPLIAGFAIDAVGFRFAFAALALLPIVPVVALARGRLNLPAPVIHAEPVAARSMFDLLQHPALRRVYVINAAFALGWDLHTVFVPIYGSEIGLSAAQIGAILAMFAAATFVVRLAMPWLVRRWRDATLMTAALLCAGAVYLVFPFLESALALAMLSFVLGLALGTGQPMVLAQLHTIAPPGRVGEAVGMRMSLIQTMSVAVPLVFGALTSTIGLVPVFWSVGLCIGGGGLYARRR